MSLASMHESPKNSEGMGRVLILGCGYLGQALGKELHRLGVEVIGWVHSVESAVLLPALGITPWVGDIAKQGDWEGWRKQEELRQNTPLTAVVHCASSGRGGVERYEAVYGEGVRRAIEFLPGVPLFFVSSTSVYGQTDGAIVTEESPAEPTTETGRVLRKAEQSVLERGGNGSAVFRFSGIYGPGRGILLQRFLNGEAMIEGDGLRWMNQIHRDDGVGALMWALRALLPPSLPCLPLASGIYNVSDREPVSYLTYYGWLAERLGKSMPLFGPINLNRKRGWTHKRVSSAKLEAAGWSPRYATFREGVEEILRSEGVL